MSEDFFFVREHAGGSEYCHDDEVAEFVANILVYSSVLGVLMNLRSFKVFF